MKFPKITPFHINDCTNICDYQLRDVYFRTSQIVHKIEDPLLSILAETTTYNTSCVSRPTPFRKKYRNAKSKTKDGK